MASILIVEDESILAKNIKRTLSSTLPRRRCAPSRTGATSCG